MSLKKKSGDAAERDWVSNDRVLKEKSMQIEISKFAGWVYLPR